MKKKNREITVFSLSALDLFCSAMGVFMILCFIVFPYYKKDTVQQTPPTEEPSPQQVAPAPVTIPAPTPQTVPSITVAIKWEKDKNYSGDPAWILDPSDIDLHVDVPMPNNSRFEFSYQQKKHPNPLLMPAQLIVDQTRGGCEVWVHPHVTTPGEYKIYFNIFSKESIENNSRPPRQHRITPIILTSQGEMETTPIIIPSYRFVAKQKMHIGTITVTDTGEITYRAHM